MKLNEKLKELRESKGLSLREAAKVTGLSFVSLCNYECGKSIPSAINIAKLAESYGADYEELYRLRKE